MIKSAIFDSKLLDDGKWDEEALVALHEWVETEDLTEKRLRASKLLPVLIKAAIGSELSNDGKVRSKRIGDALIYLEDLLLTSKSGLAKKFYRDHLNHMIRVTILARAIARVCLGSEANDVTLAALFHDLGYPVAESRNMIEASVKALQSCFACVHFAEHSYWYDMEKATRLIQLLTPYDSSDQLAKALSSYEHSVIGAIEFLDYVSHLDRYVNVVEAIVFHDSSFQRSISLRNSPVLATVVIADELQDWGRPVGFERTPAIDSIEAFELKKGLIHGRMQSVRSPSFSPLRQISSKLRSLARLKLDLPLDLEFEIQLPQYQKISFSALQDLAAEIARLRMSQGHDIAEILRLEEDDPVFHETYFGVPVSDATNQRIIERLRSPHGGSQVPPILLFDPSRYEILQSEGIEDPRSFVIASEGEKISLHVKSSQGKSRGRLSDMSDLTTKGAAEMLIGMIRAVNVMLRYETNGTRGGFHELKEFLLGPEEAFRILSDLGLAEKSPDSITVLRGIRTTIQQEGFFRFEPSLC